MINDIKLRYIYLNVCTNFFLPFIIIIIIKYLSNNNKIIIIIIK